MNMNSKLTQAQLGVVSVFALTLALTSPAFAQCVGNSCQIQQNASCASCARASYAYAPTAPRYASCWQWQANNVSVNPQFRAGARTARPAEGPFGGFFRNLFGFRTNSYSCGTACAQTRPATAPASCQTCSGATCLADPVGRENAPDAATDKEFATVGYLVDRTTGEKYELVPGDESTPPGYKKVESNSDSCDPCEAVEKCEEQTCDSSAGGAFLCGAVRATWLEKKLFDCANAQRRAAGLRPFLFDGRLIQWARFNSSLQARYCRVGHFSGYGAEIAGEGYATPEAAVQGWLDSAPHRVILLNGGYTRCGCACYQGANGKFYWTMSFGR